jgi:hypothetical protein
LLDDAVRLEHTHDVDFGGLGIKIFNGKAGHLHGVVLLVETNESVAVALGLTSLDDAGKAKYELAAQT